MRRFAVSFLLVLCCLCTAHSQSVYSLEQTPGTPPAVPRMIVFAGDTVRLTRPDIRERLDRELIAFTYSHSSSLLMLKRSRRIFEQIVPILQLHGIPEDLKYLMAIESNLDPRALSPAGAAGLWQFMKASGREYGLVIDEEVDER